MLEKNIKQERNYNIDILRAFSILLIVFYHSWVRCGSAPLPWSILAPVVVVGGKIGVAAFFVLSGYGIFCSLQKTDEMGELKFLPFMKKRMTRILPQYLMCILIYYTLMGGDIFNPSDIKNLITHLLFIHSFFPAYHGAINGVFWTMGIIVQFYIIAIPLYKLMKKWRGWCVPVSMAVTILAKVLIYQKLAVGSMNETVYYSIYGGQLITVLDNFVVGMWVAQLWNDGKLYMKKWTAWTGTVLGCVWMVIHCYFGEKGGISSATPTAYIWYSVLALCLAMIAICFSRIKINRQHASIRFFLWISKYEYGIYVWHLLIINSILTVSPWIWTQIRSGRHWMVYGIFMVLSIGVGYVMSKVLDNIQIFPATQKPEERRRQ